MLTLEEAKKIGIKACIKKIGSKFDKEFAVSACGNEPDEDNKLFCFVGVDKQTLNKKKNNKLILNSISRFVYTAYCTVDMETGKVEYIK